MRTLCNAFKTTEIWNSSDEYLPRVFLVNESTNHVYASLFEQKTNNRTRLDSTQTQRVYSSVIPICVYHNNPECRCLCGGDLQRARPSRVMEKRPRGVGGRSFVGLGCWVGGGRCGGGALSLSVCVGTGCVCRRGGGAHAQLLDSRDRENR